jgi:hypothetical protein
MRIPDVPRKEVISSRERPAKNGGFIVVFSLECGHEYEIAKSLTQKPMRYLGCRFCWNALMDEKFPQRVKLATPPAARRRNCSRCP